MFISVQKINERYSFIAGDSPSDDMGAHFNSAEDYFLTRGVMSSYETYAAAHSAASRLIDDRPSNILAKKASFYRKAEEGPELALNPEDSMVSHYSDQMEIIGERVTGIGDEKPRDAKTMTDAIIGELDGIEPEMMNLLDLLDQDDNVDKINALIADAARMRESLQTFSDALGPQDEERVAGKKDNGSIWGATIRAFSEAAAQGLQPIHEDVYVKEGSYDPESDAYFAVLAEPEKDLVVLRFNENLLLTDVMPAKGEGLGCGCESKEFFGRYWEPIVASVGHFYSPGIGIVGVPSVNQTSRDRLCGFDIEDKQPADISISFPKDTWSLSKAMSKEAASKFTEDQLVPGKTEVRFIDKNLPTYYSRTGRVTQVVPKPNHAEVAVDFGRGLGDLWVEDSQIQIVEIGE
jgi:hypothetical protein